MYKALLDYSFLAAQVLNILIGGAVNSFGVTYLHLLDLHQQSAGDTAWIGSMANALGLLLGSRYGFAKEKN